MTPNRQSPAYALFARRPIVPQSSDVLAADPPAGQDPLTQSGTEDTSVRSRPLLLEDQNHKAIRALHRGGVAHKF